MVVVDRPPANRFVAIVRRIYNPIGFGKGYNFVLWFILAGAMMGFVLARMMYFDMDGIFCPESRKPGQPRGALPAECYWYQGKRSRGRIGIILHLAGILPGGFLVVFQFIPVIRHKLIIFHRINGYLVILLSIVSTAGALMIARFSFGGALDTQIAVGLASIIFMVSQGIAYYNIKRLQIEQHRAWMIRGWVISSFIISMRIISALMSVINSAAGETYYGAMPCYVVDFLFKGNQTRVIDSYPTCNLFYNGVDPDMHVAVAGDTGAGRVDRISQGWLAGFGAAGWLAMALHIIGVEMYLHLTPAEGERLRRISYQRQLEAGMKNPGNAGLTVQKMGDAEPWSPPSSTPVAEVVHANKTSDRESNEISM